MWGKGMAVLALHSFAKSNPGLNVSIPKNTKISVVERLKSKLPEYGGWVRRARRDSSHLAPRDARCVQQSRAVRRKLHGAWAFAGDAYCLTARGRRHACISRSEMATMARVAWLRVLPKSNCGRRMRTLKPMPGYIREIYIGPQREGPMQCVTAVRAIAGQGLAGDRFAEGRGSYSRSKGVRDVTLIEMEALWELFGESGIDLHPSLTRRNLVTEGVRLSELIGAAFTIGPVRLLGLRVCPPCHHLAKLVGIPEVLGGLAHSGGIYAEVLSDGLISVEDSVGLVARH